MVILEGDMTSDLEIKWRIVVYIFVSTGPFPLDNFLVARSFPVTCIKSRKVNYVDVKKNGNI